MDKQPCVAFWFRRDLRLDDNVGLNSALQGDLPVLPIFIFDQTILSRLEDIDDARVSFIHRQLKAMDEQLRGYSSGISCWHGKPAEVWAKITEQYDVKAVYTNRDYEPQAIARDKEVAEQLRSQGILFYHFKDQVIFERDEVVKEDGSPYSVFTPYSRKWKKRLEEYPIEVNDLPADPTFLAHEDRMLSLEAIGFKPTSIKLPGSNVKDELIRAYAEKRNFPGIPGTSKLGIHLRFGTISLRRLALRATGLSETYLNELIWREFYQMILYHHPRVVEEAFRPAYDRIPWKNEVEQFELWREGRTGYPIVDAGMRELEATGFMHNRARMIVASFLCKHLLIDWRWGEAWFARKLLDFDLASNNGGWQWASGSGCDAAPYFRVFSPDAQTKKFDKSGEYIRRWVPELDSLDYPRPMIDHAFARKRAIDTYKAALA